MSVIPETYNRSHNILELVDILPNASFTTNESEVIITNKNVKYELTNELPNDVYLKESSKFHVVIVLCPAFFPK